MNFSASRLTSQHFWDQMNAVPVDQLAVIEQELVREVVRVEQLQLKALAYDTTNFYTHIAVMYHEKLFLSPKLSGKARKAQTTNKAGTDLRQMAWRVRLIKGVRQLPLGPAVLSVMKERARTCGRLRSFSSPSGNGCAS